MFEEITIKGAGEPGADEIDQADWVSVNECSNILLVNQLKADLNPGESEAIALALELKSDLLLIDELKGRKVAENYQLKIIGLLGVLLQAKQKMLIPEIKPLLLDLEMKANFYMSEILKKEILNLANE